MNNIAVVELMELLLDTLQKCGLHLLEVSDEQIAHDIFEEFDIGATSFLHESSLLRLRDAELINDSVVSKCNELRRKVFGVQNTEDWDVASVKTSTQWRDIMQLSDAIKLMLE